MTINLRPMQKEDFFLGRLKKQNWEVKGLQKASFSEIRAFAPDMLVTFDLAGFEKCTLTDSVVYNLLDSKQIHMILNENLPNERFLQKQMSLSMFFYCAREDYYVHLKNTYPKLPWLKSLKGWKQGTDKATVMHNADILAAVVREVANECNLI